MASSQISAFMRIIGIPLAYYLIRFYLSLVRIRVVNEDTLLNHLKNGGKAIGAFWHQRFFGAIGYAKKFSTLAPSVIISQSRDGEMIARVAIRLGFRPVRGSSSRGGKEALAAIIKDLALNPIAVHAVDGPQGPKGVVKAGLIRMAQLSRAAIFPVYISVDRAWIMRSWDRFLIPKPFSRILIRWGDPIFVPENIDAETFEAIRLDIESEMIQGYAQDDLNWGWARPL
ncbi:MAG: lysophospholipid acyltransferase family protein [Proteobacteria bacterium]|nr:lysophospholipid acyltransferase family protein [Pseudomonadota bacterium]